MFGWSSTQMDWYQEKDLRFSISGVRNNHCIFGYRNLCKKDNTCTKSHGH